MTYFEENKKYFGRYQRYVNQIERLTERFNELSKKISSTHSNNLDGMPRSSKVHSLDDDIIELDELGHRINSIKKESRSLRHEITNTLDHLDNPDYSAILEERFIHNKPMNVIADEIYRSERQTARLYSKVMNEYRFDKDSDAPLSN
ncbi:hypothetical protein [Companilactobacillus sp. HBUAS59699]|uniref:hypothetical protein n=1 Tax=Companilactobacillus sp. HBUAS59699 TaxID=3109358 RepID=UPI002FF0CB93